MSGYIKYFTFFFLLWGFGQIFSLAMDGQSALVTTTLSQGIGPNTSIVTVSATTGFRSSDTLLIDSEILRCSVASATTFACTRGYAKTQPDAHPSGSRVYNQTTGYLNQFLGYNIAQTYAEEGAFWGTVQVARQLPSTFANVFSKLVAWDYRFLDGHASWIRYALYAISAAFGFSLVLVIFGRQS
jgi:hypothetical protein